MFTIELTRDICTRFFIKKKKNICDQRLSDDWVIRTRRSLRRPIIPEAINARNIRVYYVPDVYAWGEVKSSGSKGKDGSSSVSTIYQGKNAKFMQKVGSL